MTESGRVMAVGFFDGVHIGHGELLRRTKQKAVEIGAIPAVLSFDTHPDDLVFSRTVRLISNNENREELIRRCYNIQEIFFLHFDSTLMNMPWEQFVSYSSKKFNIRCFVVGYDFTFGKNGEGTALKLKEYCVHHGLECEIIDAVSIDEQVVSSTLIRSLIENGEIEKANRFLGHPYCLSDTVHSGFHIGRKLQAPTINLIIPQECVVPKYGVYATKVVLHDGREYMAATNVGVRPTFENGGTVSVECFLLHFTGDLYGIRVRVDFYGYLRSERRFDDTEQLSDQIHRDALESEKYLLRFC